MLSVPDLAALQILKPLAVDLQSILQLDCLAGSDFEF
jgi:hypothetical protein